MICDEGSQRNGAPVKNRGNNVDIVVALVERHQRAVGGDLLAEIVGVAADPVVIHADPVVRVSRDDGELQAGGESVVRCEIPLTDHGVLHVEPRLVRTKG